MEALMAGLDPCSGKILSHLLRVRHAHVDELTAVASLRCHSEVLYRIREIINPLASRCLGRPVVELRRLWVDPATGESVSYHWWVDEGWARQVRGQRGRLEVRESGTVLEISVEPGPGSILSGDAEVWVRPKGAVVRLGKGPGRPDSGGEG